MSLSFDERERLRAAVSDARRAATEQPRERDAGTGRLCRASASSTAGLRSGDLLAEIDRLRKLNRRLTSRAKALRTSRDRWRERARAAEWGLRQQQRRGA